ncbi:MAG: AMP-binding protein [Granulosicoccus sp.]
MTFTPEELDTQPSDVREKLLFADFPARLKAAAASCSGLAQHLAAHSLEGVNSREQLAQLPVLRKTALMEAQQSSPPFGGFVDIAALRGSRIFMSPGPVWEPQLITSDPWQSARALRAAGFAAGDIIHNAFSYHMTPGGFILDEGARALGCIVFPAGVGNTEAQVTAIRHTQAVAYVGTPDYLQTLLDHAVDSGSPLSSIRRALVSGGALFPAMRDAYRNAGIQVLQCYATADLGTIAYESETDGQVNAGMLVNEDLIVEIVQPGSGEPVAAGEIGEVVVTRLNPVYPLLRFATGDLSAFIDEPSPCGRTAPRIKGWLGRADQRTKVRGMFVDPEQVQAVKNEHDDIERVRLVVQRDGNRDTMRLDVVLKAGADASAAAAANMADTLKRTCNIAGSIEFVESLKNDGLVIEDKRDYE